MFDNYCFIKFGDFVSMIMNHLPDESSIISGPSDQNNIDSLPDLANFPSVRARTARQPEQGISHYLCNVFF